MNASKIQSAMAWLDREGSQFIGKLRKTFVSKQGTPEPEQPADGPIPPAEFPPSPPPSSIVSTPELMNLKDCAKAPAPEPEPAPPSPPPQAKTDAPAPKPQPKPAQAPLPPPAPSGPVAVLTLDEHGEILAARD
ncbi:MAG TPA: hypothetical protein VK850_07540, partial [Candidatus Binatia bacterium]|nr:hypothetical protein [Candidatus Binatia bacterium]